MFDADYPRRMPARWPAHPVPEAPTRAHLVPEAPGGRTWSALHEGGDGFAMSVALVGRLELLDFTAMDIVEIVR